MKLTKHVFARLAPIVVLTSLFIAAPFHEVSAQVAPPMGTTQNFAVLGSSTVTNTGPTIITGDLGVDPGTAITGFPPGTVVGGTTDSADAVALQAQSDNTTAYKNLAGQACNNTISTDLGGLTLVPGVYCFSSSAQLTGTLTLDAGGVASAVWVFQIGSTLTTASNSSVVLENGAQNCNVFWQIGSSTTLGTGTTFVGNIFALTSITLDTSATVAGRALAQTGAVTMDSNTVAVSVCGTSPVTPVPPTLSKAFNPATINAGGSSTLTITLSNAGATLATLTAPLTDTLPTGVLVSDSASTTCVGGTASAAGSTVTLTGGTIPAGGSCTVTVPVTASSGGNYLNSLLAGALQTNNGSNAAPAVATLTVNAPALVAPTLGKAFSPTTIGVGGSSTLTITLSNAGTASATLTAPLADTLPSGVVVAGGASTTCVGGTVSTTGGSTVTPAVFRQQLTRQPRMRTVAFRMPAKTLAWFTGGASTVTLTGGTIPAGGSCTVTVPVTAPVAGSYFNALAAGTLQTSNGNNAAPAVATLTVLPVIPPTLSKSFSPATILAGGSSTLTITLNNPNNTIANLTATLTDTLPTGLLVAGNVSSTCIAPPPTGASTQPLTRQPRIETVAFRMPAKVRAWLTTGTSTVSMAGGSIPAGGSCTVTVLVTAPAAGSYTNTLPVGALQTNLGNNTITGAATLVVGTIMANVTPGASATIAVGSSANFAVSLASTNGVSGLVSFGCAGLAATLNCAFNPPQLTVPASGPVTTTLTVAVSAKPSSASVHNGPPDFWPNPSALHMALAALFFLMVPVITAYRRKDMNLAVLTRWLPALALVLVLGIGLVSCGGTTTGSAGSSGGTGSSAGSTGSSSGTASGSGNSSGSGGTSGGGAGGDSIPVTTQFTLQAKSGSVAVDLSTLTVTVP